MTRKNFKLPNSSPPKYSEDTLKKALNQINEKKINIHQASVRYNIPYATLHNRLHKKYIKPGFGKGSSPWISGEFENLLADIICYLCNWGHGIHFPFIRDLVSNYLISNKIPNRFKNNTPGKDWFYHFLNRWKHKIGTRYAKNMSSARANSCTSETIERFFEMLSSHKLNEVSPKNLWNVVCLLVFFLFFSFLHIKLFYHIYPI